MKDPLFRALVVVTAATCALAPAAALAADGADHERAHHRIDSERIDAWITARMDASGIPGAAVAVVQDGEPVHLRGYGDADTSGRPVTVDTPFLIGSASKPFTAQVVAQLVDEGALSLDERVLPHLAHLVVDPPEGFEQVTVRQLLEHTSGLSMMAGVAGEVEIHDTDDALDRRVADVLERPLAFEPGVRYGYSNAGPTLLAAVVEQITGQTFAEVLSERIFEPLGMADTFASEAHPAASRLATGHRLWFGRWLPADLPYDPAGVAMGYIGSSARDLATFLEAHLTEDATLAITAGEIADGTVVPTGAGEPLEAFAGPGWFVDHLGGQRVVSHAGSLGHFTTHLIMVPDMGAGIVVATNASAFAAGPHASQYDLSLGLLRMLLDLEPEPAGRSVLMTLVAPILVWVLVAALVWAAFRHVARTLPRWQRDAGPVGRRRWVGRVVLPALAFATIGAGLLLAAPLGLVRHFAPDFGWGATVLAYLAVAWALLRTVVTTIALRSTGQSGSPASPASPTGSQAVAVPSGSPDAARTCV